MIRAFGYVRCSSLTQLSGDGPERQEQAIRTYAKIQGIEIVRIFTDSATGTTDDLTKRVAFGEMLLEIMGNGVRTVIVESADRFARDLICAETLIGKLKASGAKLFDSSGNDLTVSDGNPTKKFIRQILGAVAELAKAELVWRMRAGKQAIKARGERCEGTKPYGQHPKYPDEAKILAEMVELQRSGLSVQAVADELNRRKYRMRNGNPWSMGQTRNVLQYQKNGKQTKEARNAVEPK